MLGDKIEEKKQKARQLKVRIVTLVSVVAFFGTFGSSTIRLFMSGLEQPTQAESAEAALSERERQLKAQERGYEIVLEREPENRAALEGLANVRLQLEDAQGAIEPLEKLVGLYPNRADYQNALDSLKKQVEE
ncbi:MAG: tetratricopeptide repeat protein [Oscillatoria sp. SIO1A7]|nr:tetratricopeptide repeat protein [Oscillatoria sp. SIO1A7]